MSGGVDSTATAIMLKKKYDVTGYFMQLAQPNLPEQIKNVKDISSQINIPLKIIDLQSQFSEYVLRYFSQSYFLGKTPNPCMICNKHIKFGLFLQAILDSGMEKAATGHYANIMERNGIFHLYKGADTTKDQSYFLARLSQTQLSKVLFPLGNMTKESIYHFTEKNGFSDFRGNESQDVCFLHSTSVGKYLEQQNTERKAERGQIINRQGIVLGEHEGIHRYTIGQRKGLGISDKTPYYVVRLDSENNSVIVGKNEDLHSSKIQIHKLHWIAESNPNLSSPFTVKIRYTHSGETASLHQEREDVFNLIFDIPQRAITPGQFAVLYRDEEVIGSGEIL